MGPDGGTPTSQYRIRPGQSGMVAWGPDRRRVETVAGIVDLGAVRDEDQVSTSARRAPVA